MNILKRIKLLHIVLFLVISIAIVLAILNNYPHVIESNTTSTEPIYENYFSKPSEGEGYGIEQYIEQGSAGLSHRYDIEKFIEEDGYIVLVINNHLEKGDITLISHVLSGIFSNLRMNKNLFQDGIVRLENDGKFYDINVIDGMQ